MSNEGTSSETPRMGAQCAATGEREKQKNGASRRLSILAGSKGGGAIAGTMMLCGGFYLRALLAGMGDPRGG